MSVVLSSNTTTQTVFSQAAVSLFELVNPTLQTSLNNIFNIAERLLVCHDNKPKLDEKAGYFLPRFGVVDVKTGHYHPVHIKDGSPLKETKDLESLALIEKNRFIACQSNATCFHFEVNKNKQGKYLAEYISKFKLPVPKNKFSNIEAVTLQGNKICWSHRGGIYAGEEPWTRCASIDIKTGITTPFVEREVKDPFGLSNPLNRAISDHAVGKKTSKDYFTGTIDTEGSEGIAATSDIAYSIIYTKYKCIERFSDTKIEALHVSPDEKSVIFGTDSEKRVSQICFYDLISRIIKWCIDLPRGEEYGIGGIAEIEV